MKNVVGYVRVSTQGQVKDGYSLQYQMDEIKRYCNQNNHKLLRIYEDRGISGAKVDEEGLTVEREGLQNMLADIAHTSIHGIVVLNTSRLWRSDMAKVLIQRELKRHQVDECAIEQSNYSIYAHDPNDFLVNGMLELLDQYQRLEIALKLGRGRRKKAEQGGYAGGGIAFGYKISNGHKGLIVDARKAQTVQRLFDLKQVIQSFVRELRFKQEELRSITDELRTILEQVEYKLETMPGIDLVTAGYLIAEIGDINRFANADKLARFAGIAPVTFSSAGKGKAMKSRQGNRILNGLFYNLAMQQIQVAKASRKPRNKLFYEYYHRRIKEDNKTRGQAMVCVMRRLVNIIYGMMKNKTAFILPEENTIESQAG